MSAKGDYLFVSLYATPGATHLPTGQTSASMEPVIPGCAEIVAAITALQALATPPDGAYNNPDEITEFALSHAQYHATKIAAQLWSESATEVLQGHLLHDSQHLTTLCNWLNAHKMAIKGKLNNGTALYFDALVLGLVRQCAL